MTDTLPVTRCDGFRWDDHPFIACDVVEVEEEDTGIKEVAYRHPDGHWIRGVSGSRPAISPPLTAQLVGTAMIEGDN